MVTQYIRLTRRKQMMSFHVQDGEFLSDSTLKFLEKSVRYDLEETQLKIDALTNQLMQISEKLSKFNEIKCELKNVISWIESVSDSDKIVNE